MEVDLLIIVFFLALTMVGIHIFFNPLSKKKGKKGMDELRKISSRRPYTTRRKRYRKNFFKLIPLYLEYQVLN